MSHVVTLELFVKPEKLDEFLTMMTGALVETRARQGCELVETCVDQGQAGHVTLYEKWAARSDQESYMAWRAETGMMEALADFVTGPPKITHYDLHADV